MTWALIKMTARVAKSKYKKHKINQTKTNPMGKSHQTKFMMITSYGILDG